MKSLLADVAVVGVSQATVSVCFDNTDKDQSPVGYSDQDEIIVTRQVSQRLCRIAQTTPIVHHIRM
jgi:hypothetical protein